MIKPALYTINQGLDFLQGCAAIFDFLLLDTYELKPIVKQFCSSKKFVTTLMNAIENRFHLDDLTVSIHKKGQSSIPALLSRVLFKLISFQSPAAKQIFIETDGVSFLKKLLT